MTKRLPDIKIVQHYEEIPNVFHCSETDAPFSHCTICNHELINHNIPYVIEKAIKYYTENKVKDIIFEYALCFNCLEKMRNSLSDESKTGIDQFIMGSSDLEKRRQMLLNRDSLDVNDWISSCIVNNSDIDDLPEYQIMCQCQGQHMLYTDMPFMLSCHAAEQMQELLSKKTKDELDRFYDDFLGLPPDLKEFFKTKTIIF
jgi:hypothetical protein